MKDKFKIYLKDSLDAEYSSFHEYTVGIISKQQYDDLNKSKSQISKMEENSNIDDKQISRINTKNVKDIYL